MQSTRSTFCVAKRLLQNIRQLHSGSSKGAQFSVVDEGRAAVNVINEPTGEKIVIRACVPNGFVMQDKMIMAGPLAAFPTNAFFWDVPCINSIDEQNLSLFTIVEPKPEILIIGMNEQYELKHVLNIRNILKKYDLKFELLPVEHAARMFNLLNRDDRHIAGAFLPLKKLQLNPPNTGALMDFHE